MSKRSIRLIILAVCFALALVGERVFGDCCQGHSDWRFRRSYFSHHVPQHLQHRYPPPPSRAAYRPAYYGAHPGFSFQGGYRINRMSIFNGTSNDTTVIYEGFLRER